jgi:hypothetical protein
LSYQQLTLENRPVENKPFRYITLAEQVQYCEFIEKVGIFKDKLENIKTCASIYHTFECVNDPTHTKKVTYIMCGCRGICPRCSMSYARKRAEIMYQYIKQNLADNLDFDLKMNQIVLTFLSSDPLSSKYIHAHVLTLNIKEFDNKLIQNDYYFDLDKMRETWKNTINEFTDLDLKESDPVNIHNEYSSVKFDKKKIIHILAYVYRYPIQDLFNVQVRYGSIDYLEREQFDQANIILQIEEIKKDPKNLAWCGLMTSTKRDYLEQLLINTINELVIIKPIPFFIKQIDERSKKCPDCNYNYSEIPIDKGRYLGDNEPDFKNFL